MYAFTQFCMSLSLILWLHIWFLYLELVFMICNFEFYRVLRGIPQTEKMLQLQDNFGKKKW
jgi:hypothetical protein